MTSNIRQAAILNQFTRFKGWGNPSSHLIFIGLEEAGEPTTESEFIAMHEEYQKEVSSYDKARLVGKTKTWQIESKIAVKILPDFNGMLWQDFMNAHLNKSDGPTFLSQLYPLPKKHFNKWPALYANYFNIPDLWTYKRYIKETRFKCLKEFILQKDKAIVICFGRSGWEEYKSFFCDLPNNQWMDETKNILYSSVRHIYLTPFFDNRLLSDESINILAELIKKHSKSLPS